MSDGFVSLLLVRDGVDDDCGVVERWAARRGKFSVAETGVLRVSGS